MERGVRPRQEIEEKKQQDKAHDDLAAVRIQSHFKGKRRLLCAARPHRHVVRTPPARSCAPPTGSRPRRLSDVHSAGTAVAVAQRSTQRIDQRRRIGDP